MKITPTYYPWLAGAGLLLLAIRKKYSARQIRVAQSIHVSRLGRTIDGDADVQLSLLHQTLTAPKVGIVAIREARLRDVPYIGDALFLREGRLRNVPFIGDLPHKGVQFMDGWEVDGQLRPLPFIGAAPRCKPYRRISGCFTKEGMKIEEGCDIDGKFVPFPRVGASVLQRPQGTIVGAPPYSLKDNKPTPMEIAILYAIDPDFLIKAEGMEPKTVAQLAVEAFVAQPGIVKYAKERDPSRLIENGLSILSPAQLRSFSLEVATNALDHFYIDELAEIGAEYAKLLLCFEGMDRYRREHGDIVNFREEEAQALRKKIHFLLNEFGFTFKDEKLLSPVKASKAMKPIDAMVVGLYNLIVVNDPFVSIEGKKSTVLDILKESQFAARDRALKKSSWLKGAGKISKEAAAFQKKTPKQARAVMDWIFGLTETEQKALLRQLEANQIQDPVLRARLTAPAVPPVEYPPPLHKSSLREILFGPDSEKKVPEKTAPLSPKTAAEEAQGHKIWERLQRTVKDLE